jgi:transposase-like protein
MVIKIIDQTEATDKELLPMCPHCKTSYDSVNMTRIAGTFGKRFVYYCPHCRSTLGISHRKGFWMG